MKLADGILPNFPCLLSGHQPSQRSSCQSNLLAITNSILIIKFYILAFCVVWLLPLYFVYKYARNEGKNYNIVFLVGIFASWIFALIVALLLPKLSEEEFTKLTSKSEVIEQDATQIIIYSLGFMTLILVGFIAWMKFAL